MPMDLKYLMREQCTTQRVVENNKNKNKTYKEINKI